MIRIKDYLFDENNITEMHKEDNILNVYKRNGNIDYIRNATFDDIEWNYRNTDITPYINIAKSIAEDLATANIKIEELEGNIKLKEDEYIELSNKYQRLNNKVEELEEENQKLKEKLDNINISKNEAIEYIEDEDKKLELYYGKWSHNTLDEDDAIYLCEEIIKIRDYLLETLKNKNENIK